ncbi:PH domain-containing protein [Peterkaempfera bronchialis]|uniref:PH domain-containing protein n=1 Tax=Peterkaempfera bronchialis TaxID=2126346 RepID=A0A345T457_9ACTN|nr:PH domain-containing protein [Peterkaempfera bronchialis]AXI80762.1 PH domain-containing protein [Peterkaempfera bronchialis]
MPVTPPPAEDRTIAPGLPELPVTWRATRTRAVLLPVAALLVVMFAAMATALPENWHFYDRAALVVMGLLFAAALVMLSRPRVTADGDGVTVVNFVRTRRLAWAEIVRVNLRQGDPWAILDLADGTSLATVGIQPAAGRAQAVAAARTLRDLAEARTAAHS